MQEMRRNLLVGLFVLVGLGALGALIVLFGQSPGWLMSADTYELPIHFNAVGGIREGSLVEVNGKEIGRVDRVEFRNPERLNDGVVVYAAIQDQYRLPRGSIAETVQAGMLVGGRPPISITPGPATERPLGEGEPIPGLIRSAVDLLFPPQIVNNLDKTSTQIGEAAAALTPVLEDLHLVMQPRAIEDVDRPGGPPGNLSTAMARFDASLKHFNTVLGDPDTQSHVKLTIENLHAGSEDLKAGLSDFRSASADVKGAAEGFKNLASKGQETLAKVDVQVEQLGRSATDMMQSGSRLLDTTHGAVVGLREGKGTIGQLLTDERLYEALVLTFRRLAETTEEFNLLVKDWQKGKVRVGL